MKTNRIQAGFTLLELVIVFACIGIITIPITKVFLLPLSAHLNLVRALGPTTSHRLLFDHLSDDIRCADWIETVPEEGERDELSALKNLRITRGEETILYRHSLDQRTIREVQGPVPLKRTFEGLDADFSVDNSGRYLVVRADFSLRFELNRSTFIRHRSGVFCSHLEGNSK